MKRNYSSISELKEDMKNIFFNFTHREIVNNFNKEIAGPQVSHHLLETPAYYQKGNKLK